MDSAGLCTDNDVMVTVLNSFVRNSSFESSAVPAGVGYGGIVAWNASAGTGLNNASGPFHDNGLIPDRRQVASRPVHLTYFIPPKHQVLMAAPGE